jgi:plasmid stabilization system protein ParE
MAEYRLSPAAELDLENIWKYAHREWGLEQAERYTDLLTLAFQVLAESPMSAPARLSLLQSPGYEPGGRVTIAANTIEGDPASLTYTKSMVYGLIWFLSRLRYSRLTCERYLVMTNKRRCNSISSPCPMPET